MTTFLERNELITGLLARGFTEGRPDPTGWRYQGNGFFLRFNSRGNFTLDHPNGMREIGVAKSPAHILDSIDKSKGGQ